jgi:hypothetical protein
MVSAVDTAKRVLVTLLKSLAGIYGVVLALTRLSRRRVQCPDSEVSVPPALSLWYLPVSQLAL